MKLTRPFTHHDHPREIVRQFTPNWFTVTMGTGVLALALNQFPTHPPLLHQAGAVLWLVNILLFALCTILYAARWIFFTSAAMPIFRHPVMPMFLGAIPMGLGTIINGCVVFAGATGIAVTLWWADVAMSVAIGLLVPFLMFTRQDHTFESMTAIWLLPIVPAEVAAASGGLIAPHLAGAAAAHMLIYSYMLWAFSVPLALGVLVVLYLRLVLHKLPKREMAVSSWLALGPLGTGALGLVVLGQDAPAILGAAGMADIGTVAHGIGVIGGVLLWAYGAWWLFMAVLITLSYVKEGLPFNMGWWAFTFPLGVYALATLSLARETGMAFFTVTGAAMVLALSAFWAVVTARTLAGGYQGNLFVAPCLVTGKMLPRELETWPS
jgi:C4-dicarboxylate transporter/malic acid transport protein